MALERRRSETDEHDVRCPCGRLIARWVDAHLEIRCPRCKRVLALTWEGDPRPPSDRG